MNGRTVVIAIHLLISVAFLLLDQSNHGPAELGSSKETVVRASPLSGSAVEVAIGAGVISGVEGCPEKVGKLEKPPVGAGAPSVRPNEGKTPEGARPPEW